MNETKNLQKQLEMHRLRLAILEKQRAGFGDFHVPAHVVLDIENVQAKISELEMKLNANPQ